MSNELPKKEKHPIVSLAGTAHGLDLHRALIEATGKGDYMPVWVNARVWGADIRLGARLAYRASLEQREGKWVYEKTPTGGVLIYAQASLSVGATPVKEGDPYLRGLGLTWLHAEYEHRLGPDWAEKRFVNWVSDAYTWACRENIRRAAINQTYALLGEGQVPAEWVEEIEEVALLTGHTDAYPQMTIEDAEFWYKWIKERQGGNGAKDNQLLG